MNSVDKFMLRRYSYSLVAKMMSRQTKLPPVSTFILICQGRRSGKWIEIPIFYYRDGENYALVGSKGGAPEHPLWFLNLQANPDCKFRVDEKTYDARARVAVGEERERIWAHATKLFPPYIEYQTRCERQLPVVVLEKK
jgi:deazaflavin-dependent oxidoreductase (nitroreductase family)